MKISHTLSVTIMFLCAPLHAQVSFDGTLGRSGALPGPDYQIGANLGQQHGGNLFHKSHESATFSGPNSVNNVISRVTGGNPSTIPNADMYFLNPYGIMFGPNAKLDVQGSFHASTADYLRLQDGGQFNARQPGNSLLTVAPVEAFGFLTDSPASLSIEGSQLGTPYGKTFSLVGGDITLKGAQLHAPSGLVNLASVAQTGEVNALKPETTSFDKQGIITVSDNSIIEVSGLGAGAVFIRGKKLLLHDSVIQANTFGNQLRKAIDMVLTEAVDIRRYVISNEVLSLVNRNFGSGTAGGIAIITPDLSITQTAIITHNLGAGRGGNLDIKATQIALKEAGTLSSLTLGSGPGGQININATESISLSGLFSGTVTVDGYLVLTGLRLVKWASMPILP
ncbi:MAG: hypothetical protein DRR19_27580 [Candidatus Parabeggiatoa sp. nov. 1]|nr:MAG: hypothetical protein DRR19_27580 [Gammaproteobacteria bacterium]HEC84541.1 filamentous hemagglutinin N-terminal domain-containing protein [Thioploca sp.]